MEHYSAHSKRVRRKRNKHGHLSNNSISGVAELSGGPLPAAGTIPTRPLRAIGWKVRYDYKLALFAEFRMEEEVARKSVVVEILMVPDEQLDGYGTF